MKKSPSTNLICILNKAPFPVTFVFNKTRKRDSHNVAEIFIHAVLLFKYVVLDVMCRAERSKLSRFLLQCTEAAIIVWARRISDLNLEKQKPAIKKTGEQFVYLFIYEALLFLISLCLRVGRLHLYTYETRTQLELHRQKNTGEDQKN